MPTNSRRRSSAGSGRSSGAAPGSHSGSNPHSQQARKTTSNSSPLAACRVSSAIASARGSRASTSAPSAISVRNRFMSSPQRRASGARTWHQAVRRSRCRSRPPRRVPGVRVASASAARRLTTPRSWCATADPAGRVPGSRASVSSRRISVTPGRRSRRSWERFWNGSPARVRPWPSDAACASVRYSTAMSASPMPPWPWPSARPLSSEWNDDPPSRRSMASAIQAASPAGSAASWTLIRLGAVPAATAAPGPVPAWQARWPAGPRPRWPGWNGSSP